MCAECRASQRIAKTATVRTSPVMHPLLLQDEGSLLKAVSNQPIAIGICASAILQFYSGGVLDKVCAGEGCMRAKESVGWGRGRGGLGGGWGGGLPCLEALTFGWAGVPTSVSADTAFCRHSLHDPVPPFSAHLHLPTMHAQ